MDYDTLTTMLPLSECAAYGRQLTQRHLLANRDTYAYCPNPHCSRLLKLKDDEGSHRSINQIIYRIINQIIYRITCRRLICGRHRVRVRRALVPQLRAGAPLARRLRARAALRRAAEEGRFGDSIRFGSCFDSIK